MRRKLSVLVIIIGLIVAFYPLLEQGFTWYWQQRLLSEWENEEVLQEYQEYGEFDNLLQTDIEEEMEEDVEQSRIPLTPQGEVLGVLIIDVINLKLPIISGLNETNLKIGIAYLEDTAKFGEYGNTVLAGHRGHSRGRLLNRLDEVDLDDKIIIATNENEYIYTVYKKVIVEPEEIDVLHTNNKEKILSIVTCEPVRNPTHRLIVQAKLSE